MQIDNGTTLALTLHAYAQWQHMQETVQLPEVDLTPHSLNPNHRFKYATILLNQNRAVPKRYFKDNIK